MSNFLKPILSSLNKVFDNLNTTVANADNLNKYLEINGWIPGAISNSDLAAFKSAVGISSIIQEIQTLIINIENQNSDIETLVDQLLPIIKSLYTTLDSANSINYSSFSVYPLDQNQFWIEFSQNIFPYVLSNYLRRNQPVLYSTLYFFGIIDFVATNPNTNGRIPYTKAVINFSNIGQLFTDPNNLVRTRYNWGNNLNVNSSLLFQVLHEIFSIQNLNSKTLLISDENYSNYYSQNSSLNNGSIYQHEIPLFDYWAVEQNNLQKVAIEVLPIPRNNSTSLVEGLLIKPSVQGLASTSIPLSPTLFLKVIGAFSSDNFLDFKIFPDTSQLLLGGINSLGTDTKVSLVAAPRTPWILIGDSAGTRLLVNGIEISIQIAGDLDNPEIIFRIGNGDVIKSSFVHFIFDPSDGDNFITSLLGNHPFNIDFGFGLKWSSKSGIGFDGNGGFSISIPIHQNRVGADSSMPVQLTALTISVGSNDGAFTIGIGADVKFNLGPVSGTINNIGTNISLKTQSGSSKGIFGNLDFDFSFKPPTGLGIAIDADPVTGGGFLNYNAATSSYTGALQLKFSEISLNAIGVLTTKMPDGGSGYSLLIIITADFTPVQLGFGFTLNGVGGLLGLNRTMNTDRLRTGIKDGSINNILFPQDVVANATAIISNISQAFPVQKGQFLIGPMAKIGWGTPTILTIELGVIIQLPTPPVFAILGVVKTILPSDSSAVIKINVNFLGVFDFRKKYLSFDASLYDSDILGHALVGDMALRLYWGDNPNFLLSVGGFNPKYTPPPNANLPALQRLGIMLANDQNLKINAQAYFAVTSNTAQFGASVSLVASAWKIQAVGAIYFDVLFQFSPFYFMADMGASFAIKMGGSNIMSVNVDMTLAGPNPWRAQGKASFKVVFVRVNVSFDKTFGQARPDVLPPIQVMPQFKAAISNIDNWQVIGPDRSNQVVTFREIVVPTGQLIVDPFGTLRFSQKLLPLGVLLQKFGTSAISDDNLFTIGAVTSNGAPLFTSSIQDFFSPNSFFNLTNDQRLSRASYELYGSGISVGDTTDIKADYGVTKDIEYEDIIVDLRQRVRITTKLTLSDAEFNMHVTTNYVSNSPLSSTDKATPLDGATKVKVSDKTSFVLADRNTLLAVSGTFGNYDQAIHELQNSIDPNAANYMVVNSFELV